MSENLIGATTAVFPIRLSVAVSTPVDVEWSTRDGSAIAGSDYKAAAGTVTFLPGETEKQIEVQVYGQAITPADDKKFFIRLNPPSNAVLVDAILTCTINIIDDQGVPSVAVVVAEGRRGPKGDHGLSAYEQAVLMGYTGTVEEWMDQIADASQAADRAQGYSNTAAEEALKAQNAARNAVFAGVIFPTPEEGVDPILGVQNGAYFNVRSLVSDHYIDEYQNVNGVAVPTGKSYPTSEHFQDLSNNVSDVSDKLHVLSDNVDNISKYIALPFVTDKSYELHQRVQLNNGDIARSLISNNTNDPNINKDGWLLVGNLIIVKTVTELLDKDLKDGDFVRTIGYHNISDHGGAFYVISDTSNDYSIPLNNGKNAIFADSFDVRKFGIIDSKTLDQSENLKRLVAYADSRFYEIDFLGFSIMNPEIYQFTTSRGSVIKGLGFNYLHKIKNLHISNNKTKSLVQGTSCLLYLPKAAENGILSLENVTFDPYVSDYVLNYEGPSGEYDGMMTGFIAIPHPDWASFDYSQKLPIKFDFKDIDFDSAAVSYNLSTAGLYVEDVVAKNLTGQYLGLYLFSVANLVDCDQITGVLRDDLGTNGRSLVKNLIHDEAELGSGTINQLGYNIKNCHSTKYSDGSPATTFKHHSVGNPIFEKLYAEKCTGTIELYALPTKTTKFKTVEVVDCRENFNFLVNINIDEIIFRNSISDAVLFDSLSTHKVKKISGYSSKINNLSAPWSGTVANKLDSLYLEDCEVSDNDRGLFLNNLFHVDNIEMNNIKQTGNVLLNGSFNQLIIDGYRIDTASGSYGNCIVFNSTTTVSAKAIVSGLLTTNAKIAGTNLFNAYSASLNAELLFSRLQEVPTSSGYVTLTKFSVTPSV